MTRIDLGPLTLTRVLYTDAQVPADRVGLDASQIAAVPWNDDRWSSDDGQVRVGAAAWVISHGEDHLVIDPFMAADDIFHDVASTAEHQSAIAAAFDAAGIPINHVTGVVQSHMEGIGMVAVRSDDGWVPFFPNARIQMSEESLDQFRTAPDAMPDVLPDALPEILPDVLPDALPERSLDDPTFQAWNALLAADLVDTYRDGTVLLPGVIARHTGAHDPGHHVFHVHSHVHSHDHSHDHADHGSTGDRPAATLVGHLAVSPLHLSTGPCLAQHPEPELAWELLCSFADDGRILIGPLWPSPGAGRMIGDTFASLDA